MPVEKVSVEKVPVGEMPSDAVPSDEAAARAERLVLYVAVGCHLCETAAAALAALATELGEAWASIDIATDSALQRRYLYEIPVVAVDGRPVCIGRVDRGAVRRALGA